MFHIVVDDLAIPVEAHIHTLGRGDKRGQERTIRCRNGCTERSDQLTRARVITKRECPCRWDCLCGNRGLCERRNGRECWGGEDQSGCWESSGRECLVCREIAAA